jgi:hypothetical protein
MLDQDGEREDANRPCALERDQAHRIGARRTLRDDVEWRL